MDEWKIWSLEELEKQMNPSNWNPWNLTSEQVVNKYVELGLNGTNQALETLAHSVNVSYGPGAAEKVDFYGTDLPVDSPLFFYIHGGYWQEGSKNISGHFANVLHSWGFMTAVMGYTLAPPESKIL
jgi:arylformamidase